jgi:DNA-binding HxlR family transcriptional regulator
MPLSMVMTTVPPIVEYSLTPLGETLVQPLTALCAWASEHLHEVDAARAKASVEKSKVASK